MATAQRPASLSSAREDRGAANLFSAETPLRIGTVALAVRDLETVSRFYQRMIGLAVLESGPGFARLGAGGSPLLELRHEPGAQPDSAHNAGLYHTAFLLPTRADLGRWLVQAREQNVVLQGASDHSVSEALYLADPEGNGIEMYCDRPREAWTFVDGMLEMSTRRIDLEELVSTVDARGWSGLPEGTCVGHVHLRVGAIESAERFYTGLLGLDVMQRRPGATFYSSGGYHHHVATNVWNSVVVAAVSTSLVLVVGTLAAYSLHRLAWARWIALSFLAWTIFFHSIPVITLIGPWYIAFRQLGLYDTQAALIITHLTINLPMTVWLMMAFFKEIPPELEEAALVDGCRPVQAFWRISLPLAVPGLIASGILAFIFSWNEFAVALSLTSRETATVPVAIARFAQQYEVQHSEMAAASVISTIPAILLMFLGQRFVVRGLTLGSVK